MAFLNKKLLLQNVQLFMPVKLRKLNYVNDSLASVYTPSNKLVLHHFFQWSMMDRVVFSSSCLQLFQIPRTMLKHLSLWVTPQNEIARVQIRWMNEPSDQRTWKYLQLNFLSGWVQTMISTCWWSSPMWWQWSHHYQRRRK